MGIKKMINDDAFFEDLCNTYFIKVYGYCKKLLKGQSSDFAEECTQITFLEARKQISKLRKHPNIEGWLYTTSRNQINTLFRKQYLKRKYEIFLDEDLSETLASLDHNIEKLFDLNIDIAKAISKILKELNEHEYILYVDYYRNHMTITEIADKNNISTTAVTTRIYRLKKKIKFLIHRYIENI
jgi:RNA polymerase sigma-70 factor (ECF subfamily)